MSDNDRTCKNIAARTTETKSIKSGCPFHNKTPTIYVDGMNSNCLNDIINGCAFTAEAYVTVYVMLREAKLRNVWLTSSLKPNHRSSRLPSVRTSRKCTSSRAIPKLCLWPLRIQQGLHGLQNVWQRYLGQTTNPTPIDQLWSIWATEKMQDSKQYGQALNEKIFQNSSHRVILGRWYPNRSLPSLEQPIAAEIPWWYQHFQYLIVTPKTTARKLFAKLTLDSWQIVWSARIVQNSVVNISS